MFQVPERQFDAPYTDIFLMPIFYKNCINYRCSIKNIGINLYYEEATIHFIIRRFLWNE